MGDLNTSEKGGNMAKKGSFYNHKKMVRFFTIRYKLGFNDDENELNGFNFKTKSYDKGTYPMGQRSYKLGSGANVDLGFEKKKLE